MKENKVQRIPLGERLEKGKYLKPDFLNIFSVYVDEYFKALYEISGDVYFEFAYKNAVDEAEKAGYYFMAQYIAEMDELTHEQENERLYNTLIVPFTMINDFSLEGGKENNG